MGEPTVAADESPMGEVGRVIWDMSPDMLAVVSTDGYLKAVNPSWETALGYSPQELMSRPYLDFVHPEDVDRTIAEAGALLEVGHMTVSFENRYRRKDGDYCWMSWSCRTAENGTDIYCIVRDVTEQVNARQALADSERRYRLVAENASDVVWQLDADETMVWVTPSIENVLGWRPEQVVGTDPRELVHPNDQRIVDLERQAVYEGGVVDSTEFRLRTTAGDYRWMSAQARPTTDVDGTADGLVVGLRDVTERRLAEDRLRQQSREILELTTPVMQIWEGIVVVPLIGSLDSQRTGMFMERLLDRIVETNSPMALVDITGVPAIDTETAQHLIEAITAVRLLGAQVVLTGVRPAIAQTLVHLGVDLSGITTRSSMAAGLKVALEALSLRVVDRDFGATKS